MTQSNSGYRYVSADSSRMAADSPYTSKGVELALPQDDRIGHFIQGILQHHPPAQTSWTQRSGDPSVSPGVSAAMVQPSPKDSGVDMNSPIHPEDALHTDHEDHVPRTSTAGPGSVESGTAADMDAMVSPPLCTSQAAEVSQSSPFGSLFTSAGSFTSCSSSSTAPQPSTSSMGDLSQMWASTSQGHMMPTPGLKSCMDEDLRLFAHDLLLSDFSDCEEESPSWSFSAGLASNCDSPPVLSSLGGSKSTSCASQPGFADHLHKFLQQGENNKLKRKRNSESSEGTESDDLPVLKLKRMSSGAYTTLSTSPPILTPSSPRTPLLKIKFGSPSGEQNTVDVHYKNSPSPPPMLSREISLETSPPKSNSFNVEQHMAWRTKLLKFRKKVLILCKVLFPGVQLPSKDCPQISCLLDQMISVASDLPAPHLSAIPQSCCDDVPRVLLCSSPKACLKHLRKKACRLLEALLPGLVLGDAVDGRNVDELLHRVYSANKKHSASSGIITCTGI
ncbi:hypothetical protein CAPTEDRAFT_221979 [Capitella teleta]|uniref:Uncharacterized protein n=1 Tax=Capitella teleta TaxID=283909 RepID=R7UR60_CAPTE|nr:hypothetical protein CAPTEDRAFT_221979 [Capitella teleta]|eukprot:ELU05911.1 hypothetical protein CAPTEDRAFT_221979 [Capitella teleta]